MEDEKIERILKLVDMLEINEENKDDIAKIKKLIEQKKYSEMLEVLKKVTSKSGTKVKEEDDTIVLKRKDEQVPKEEKVELNQDEQTE